MFGDTLLESSSAPRKGKRWPMATAFTAEAIIGGLLVIIPLLSTGVIPVSARRAVPIASDACNARAGRACSHRAHIGCGTVEPGYANMAVFTFNNHQSTIFNHPRWIQQLTRQTPNLQEAEAESDKQFSDFMSDGRSTAERKIGRP